MWRGPSGKSCSSSSGRTASVSWLGEKKDRDTETERRVCMCIYDYVCVCELRSADADAAVLALLARQETGLPDWA